MSYRSDVRIRLEKKDYEKLLKEPAVFDIVGESYKTEKDNVVTLTWYSIKWYEYEFEDVIAVMGFMRTCDNYSYCRIGEYYGDIEKECSGVFYDIGTITKFDEEEDWQNE